MRKHLWIGVFRESYSKEVTFEKNLRKYYERNLQMVCQLHDFCFLLRFFFKQYFSVSFWLISEGPFGFLIFKGTKCLDFIFVASCFHILVNGNNSLMRRKMYFQEFLFFPPVFVFSYNMTNWCREFEVNVNMYSLCLSKEENSKQFKNSLKFHASIIVLTVFPSSIPYLLRRTVLCTLFRKAEGTYFKS